MALNLRRFSVPAPVMREEVGMNTLATREIPRAQWAFFLDAFSRQHQGWTVTVEVLDEAIGAQIQGDGIPLEAIMLDAAAAGDTISVMLGGTPERHVTHTIRAPSRVHLDQTGIDVGTGEVLEIESAEGSKTLIRFHHPVLPEQLDGVA
jgi:hypothetical protein